MMRYDGRRWMSARPPTGAHSAPSRKKVTIQALQAQRTPITMLTAYDFPTARFCEASAVDIVLVGDSLAQVCLGHASTTELTLSAMLHHARAVSRGCRTPLLIADMPFGSYHISADDAVRNAVQLVQEGGMEAVKIEGGEEVAGIVRRLTGIGIPVMAHVGLMPQRHTSFSGYRVQGRDAETARGVLRSAERLQEAGAFAVLVEAVPHVLGKYITRRLRVPTIGIGAGPGTTGQVLVWDDVMGNSPEGQHKPKFVRRFADVGAGVRRGLAAYTAAVKDGSFPDIHDESYGMDAEEWKKFCDAEGDPPVDKKL
ncbi:hypothetical protein PLICRDRAFT_170211 [Plicaturopsis crispa FD-325 SS-3]|nr:hypothetical protein PLICRDRAFT_170211 [Plicaturopsis crispa FD-325 SS-3]